MKTVVTNSLGIQQVMNWQFQEHYFYSSTSPGDPSRQETNCDALQDNSPQGKNRVRQASQEVRKSNQSSPMSHFRWWQRLMSGGLATLMVMGCQSFNLLAPIDYFAYRLLFRIRGERPWDENIVIVSIDEQATRILNDGSGGRKIYAKLLNNLAQSDPGVIVLNILMKDKWENDALLGEAMKANAPVILPIAWNSAGEKVPPNSLLEAQAQDTGHIYQYQENDGIPRQITPLLKDISALGLVAAETYQQKPLLSSTEKVQPFWINWPGSVDNIDHHSLPEVIRGKVPPEVFQDKIVLVGVTATGFDSIKTPFDKNFEASSIHLHAAVIDNLLQKHNLRLLNISKNPLLFLVVLSSGLVLSWVSTSWSLQKQVLVGGGLWITWIGTGFLLLHFNYWLPISAPLLLMGLTTVGVALQGRVTIKEQLTHSEQTLWQKTFYDQLTGLPSRELFLENLEDTNAVAREKPNYLYAVLCLDLDRFGFINDSFGRQVGDCLLIAVAHELKKCLKLQDNLACFGGDFFVILLDHLKSPQQALKMVEKIHRIFSEPFTVQDQELFITVSIGIAFNSNVLRTDAGDAPLQSESSLNILHNAEIAMHQAKVQGKDCYTVFDDHFQSNTIALLQLETDLRHAVRSTHAQDIGAVQEGNNPIMTTTDIAETMVNPTSLLTFPEESFSEFCLYYQPIVDLKTDQIMGFEALVRWYHPVRGLISPVEFIPVAEQTGLIKALGQWILRAACRQLKIWHQDLPRSRPVKMIVNLSTIQLKQFGLLEQIQSILKETQLDYHSLKLEITESSLMEDSGEAMKLLKDLKALGIQLSLDDFGTGYSSLGRLHNLPVNTLKIDQSFVKQTLQDESSWEIIQTIITLAHNLGMTVVAEGIETPEQLAHLKKLNADYGQGYWFAKPLNTEAATTLLQQDSPFFNQRP